MAKKFELNNVVFGVLLLCLVIATSAYAVDFYGVAALYIIIGFSALFMGEEPAHNAVYGLAHRTTGEYVLVEDDAVLTALTQAKADDKAAVDTAIATAWRTLMVDHVVSAAALLSVDYDLIRGLGLSVVIEYNGAGKPVVRVR